jgi:hypothetical protein
MFADAVEKAMKFTRPVIISYRTLDGTVVSSCASFVMLNREGWMVTAGHVFDSMTRLNDDAEKIRQANTANADGTEHVKMEPKWVTNQSFWWGWDGVTIKNVYINREIDVAIGKLEPFNPDWILEYPVMKDPDTMRPGTSLCRIGFPFTKSTTDFSEKTQTFHIREGVLPMPFFPNDCIHTRNIYMGRSSDGYDMSYIETSTPGMRGQSGGPIFDRSCKIAGIQVKTAHLPLGFHPTIKKPNGEVIVENQFINVGLGVHVRTLTEMLDSLGVKYTSETKDRGFRVND